MENKKTNRNARPVIVAIVLALVVVFLCIGGYTFAKYISEKSVPTNQATVAKWGFVINADVDELFGTQYNANKIVTGTDGAVDVKASSAVVAPGTGGSMTFGVTGSAEVLAKINISFDVKSDIGLSLPDDGASETADTYNPVNWTLKKKNADGDFADVKSGTLNDINGYFTEQFKNETVAPGTTVSHEYTLSWEWKFDNTSVADADTYDTILGYAAQGTGNYGDYIVKVEDEKTSVTFNDKTYTAVTEIDFGLKVSVEQIQNTAL